MPPEGSAEQLGVTALVHVEEKVPTLCLELHSCRVSL